MTLAGLLALDSFPLPDDVDPFGTNPTLPAQYDAMFTVVPVLIGIGFVVVIILALRRGARYVQHGIDPTVADVDLQAKLLKSDLLAPPRSPEGPAADVPPRDAAPARTVTERLAELDQLLAQRTITAEEHAAARARVLEDV